MGQERITTQNTEYIIPPSKFMVNFDGIFLFTALNEISQQPDDSKLWATLLRQYSPVTGTISTENSVAEATHKLLSDALQPEVAALGIQSSDANTLALAKRLLESAVKNNLSREEQELWDLCHLEKHNIPQIETSQRLKVVVKEVQNYAARKVAYMSNIPSYANSGEFTDFLTRILGVNRDTPRRKVREHGGKPYNPLTLSSDERANLAAVDGQFKKQVLGILAQLGITRTTYKGTPATEIVATTNGTPITFSVSELRSLFEEKKTRDQTKNVGYKQNHPPEYLLTPAGHGRRSRIYERLQELGITDVDQLNDTQLSNFFPPSRSGPSVRQPNRDEIAIALTHGERSYKKKRVT